MNDVLLQRLIHHSKAMKRKSSTVQITANAVGAMMFRVDGSCVEALHCAALSAGFLVSFVQRIGYNWHLFEIEMLRMAIPYYSLGLLLLVEIRHVFCSNTVGQVHQPINGDKRDR
jgi:hypothetical protein